MCPVRLGVLFLFAVLVGCDTSDLYDEEVGDLVLSVAETAKERELRLATVEVYPCSNYPLVVDADVSTQGARITVSGIGEVEGCRTAIGSAVAAVRVPTGSIVVGYEVAIEKGGRTDRFEYSCGVAGCVLSAVGAPEFTRIGP